jgi:hypothetical protein
MEYEIGKNIDAFCSLLSLFFQEEERMNEQVRLKVAKE